MRFELVQDEFRQDTNLNLIGRVEDFAMGLQAHVQLGRALESLESTRDAWMYSAGVSNGFDITKNSFLLTGVSTAGRYAEQGENQSLGGFVRYYHRHGRHLVYYAAVSADAVHDPDVPSPLSIGGDNGLRGYPLRYQSGERRVLFTTRSARVYRLVPVSPVSRRRRGVLRPRPRLEGREPEHRRTRGWLRDVGFGLRLLSARTSKGNVLHADFAFPLDPDPSIDRVQFLVKTKVAF